MGFTVVPANLAKVEDAGDVVNQLALSTVDSIFITGGTVVGDSLKQILEVARIAKIPTVSHLLERVENGVLLAVAANSFSLGKLAGQKASEVLHGIKPEYIPIEYLEQYDIWINMKTARQIMINMPDRFLKIATKVIE
jgi:putative ABC transport system substrate-binding protein